MSRSRSYSKFGTVTKEVLGTRQMTQSDLARQLDVTVGYVNNTMTGRKAASPRWADLVADVLEMSAQQRLTLHKAAAQDAGYKLDLTPSDKNRR